MALPDYPSCIWNSLFAVDAGDNQNICLGDAAQLNATGANTYQWAPAAGLSCTTCPNPLASPSSTTTYFVTGNDGTVDSVTVAVFSPPAILSVESNNASDCSLPNGSIIIEATGGGPLEYSISGGNFWQNSGTFNALAVGTYSIVVRNAGGACPVQGGTVEIDQPLQPAITGYLKLDPSGCDQFDGGIAVTASGGLIPLQYSIDGGIQWQTGINFQQLGAGLYHLFVRNADGSCANGDTLVVLDSPGDDPVISNIFLGHPTNCNLQNGSITISVIAGNVDLEYSIDGGVNYFPQNEFYNLSEGVYQVFAKVINDSCIANGGFVELKSFNHPVIYGTSKVEPLSCGASNGTITILAYGPSTIEFSIDGGATWQASNSFSNLPSGSYAIAVRNIDGTCETDGGPLALAGPAEPIITGVSFTNPAECGISNGSILIAATGAGSLEYTINGGSTWASSPNFTGLANGAYQIAVRYADGSCEVPYSSNPLQLASPDNPPVINSISIINAGNCGQNNGQVTINATGTGNLLYSNNGGLFFQSNPSFFNLPAGTYSLKVMNPANGCVASASATLTATPGCPDTVQVVIPLTGTANFCFNANLLDIQGSLTSATICNPGSAATVLATNLNGTCVDLTPANGFEGQSPDLICLVHCFDNTTNLCDTTYLSVNVMQVVCDDVFPFDSVSVNYAGNPTNYCVPVPYFTLFGDDLVFEGQTVVDPFGCEFVPTVAYSYSFLPGGGFGGPYQLEYWKVNGNDLAGSFQDPDELLDLMNSLDPTGNWQINPVGALIFGGNPVSTYGDMKVNIQNGNPTFLSPNFTFQPMGFTVGLTHLGIHVLTVTNPADGCSDTLYINAVAVPTVTETVFLTTGVNTPTGEFCLNGDELPGNTIVNVGYCQTPSNGVAPLANDTCVFYVPNLNFAGADTFCITVCDDGFPQFCDTTIFIVNVLPETDVVNINIPAGTASVDTCLSSFIIELPGAITSSSFCGINNNEISIGTTGNCLNISPVNNFSGTSEACIIFCSGAVCDTTIVVVTVEPPVVCADIFTQNPVTIASAQSVGFFCVGVPPGDIVGYQVLLDGVPYAQFFIPCDFTPVSFYLYGSLPAGPYLLQSWTVNGNVFSGPVSDILSLVDSMNVWDPNGHWKDVATSQAIEGGLPASVYGNLEITPVGGSTVILSPDDLILPFGAEMTIAGYGSHDLVVTAPNGCSDTTVVILEQHFVTPETLFFETPLNTSVNPICANTAELLGIFQSMNFCGLPGNGSVGVVGDTCVSYTPNLNFTGADQFCLVVCDDYQPQVCDTFYVVVTTAIPVDTVFIDAPGVDPFDECLDGTVLQLPGIIDTAFSCGINANEVNLSFNGNCISIDLNNDFTGTTVACVVHCTGDVPPICDTTILVISNDTTNNPCPEIFDPNEITVVVVNDTGEVCLPVALTDIFDYNILLDGTAYAGTLMGCDFDSAHIYNYNNVFGQGLLGPYSVSWNANGNTFTASNVADMAGLVDLMNGWDPNGNWMLIASSLTIMGTGQTGTYGVLTVTHILTGSSVNIGVTSNEVPAGTKLFFIGNGEHIIVLENIGNGCTDTLTINGINEADVIVLTTLEGIPTDTVCLDTTGLPGNYMATAICGQPQNGVFDLIGNCFTYLPNPGFTGNDEGCLVACDDQGNCDTTYVLITVVPLCSTFNLFPDGIQEIAVNNCADDAAYCVPVLLDSIANYSVLDNGSLYAGGFVACNGMFTQISLDTGFHEIVVYQSATGCLDTLLANITCTLDTVGCGISALSPLTNMAVDCDSLTAFCVGIAVSNFPNFTLSDNGSFNVGPIGTCGSGGTFISVQLDTGFHELIFTDTVKGCADTFGVTVLCYPWMDTTVNVALPVGDSSVLCLGDYGFDPSLIDSVAFSCLPNGNASFEIDETTWCITVFGDAVGLDTGCFKVYALDSCSYFFVNVDVSQPCPDLLPDGMLTAAVPCSQDSGLLCLPLALADLQNKVFLVDNALYTAPLVPCGSDSIFNYVYSDLPNDGLFGPYTVTEWLVGGISFTGTFDSDQELVDSMNVWDPLGNWQILVQGGNTLIVGGNTGSSYGDMKITQNNTGNLTTLTAGTTVVPTGLAILLELGNHLLTLSDTVLQCAETVVVEITCVSTDIFVDTILAGQSETFCLDLSELPGDWQTVVNNCAGTGSIVDFQILDSCIVYTGIDAGLDTACMVVCDDLGVCDTTFLYITVLLASDSMVVAVNDTVVAGEGQVVAIDVFQNDTIISLDDFYIVVPPAHGMAVFLPNGSINYVPEPGYCDESVPDSFTYAICNEVNCDTATVFVLVECSGLEIFNALSPNEDGKNDFFKITGLQNYPNHKLFIYNRWGNLVFEATNYQSNWDGTWDGKDLPDGTYYYILDLGEGEKPLRGYVQLNR
ncbi:MAG: gliding motility-associated C-terminal domain-containing protein [Saprospiraceae bacterium]